MTTGLCVVELEDDEYNEVDHWGEDPIFLSIEKINTQIEEMKNIMSESKKRTEVQEVHYSGDEKTPV